MFLYKIHFDYIYTEYLAKVSTSSLFVNNSKTTKFLFLLRKDTDVMS